MKFRPEHFITDVSEKYPRLWALKGANPIDGQIKRSLPTSRNKKRNQRSWSTSAKMKYPQGELREFGSVSQRWTKEYLTQSMQHDVCRKMAQTNLSILYHTRKAIVWKEFSGKKGSTRKRILEEENNKFSGEPTGSSKFVKKKDCNNKKSKGLTPPQRKTATKPTGHHKLRRKERGERLDILYKMRTGDFSKASENSYLSSSLKRIKIVRVIVEGIHVRNHPLRTSGWAVRSSS
ncbi:hypothetical protein ACS0TY_021140 [Phlomoides rotata]